MMIKEEEFLIERCGKERHFTVPEGYFAQFNAQMLQQLTPEAKIVPIRQRSVWQYVVYAAACLATVVVMGGAFLHKDQLTNNGSVGLESSASVAQSTNGGDAMEEAADYMMLDKQDLYAYLMDN